MEEDEKPSADFAQALAEFDREQGATGRTDPTIGDKVRARIVSIGDEQCFVDFGGRSEGVLETRALRNDDGSLRYVVGDSLDLFVIHVQDRHRPRSRPDPSAARRRSAKRIATACRWSARSPR
ncbi:MAG: hypothetical protein U0527_09190 [Candidatus Eisenbacteria bacterium]